MDLSQYQDIFIEETREHLLSLNQCLLLMEKDSGDTSLINEVFRIAHTLKGMAGTMGFARMARLTHGMEDVLQAIRNGELKINTDLVDLLFECFDALEGYTATIVETGSEGDEGNLHIINSLTGILDNKSSEAARTDTIGATDTIALSAKGVGALHEDLPILHYNQYDINIIKKAEELGNNIYQITVKLDKGCVLKSARAFIIFKTLEKHSDIIKSEPSVQDIEDEKFDLEFTVVVISDENESVFKKELNSIAEVREVLIKALESDMLTTADCEHTIAQTVPGAENVSNRLVREKEERAHVAPGQIIRKTKTGKTVRVDIDRLDILLNLVSELIIQKTRLEGLEGIERTPAYTETLEYLERITTNLHDAVMKVRMVPVETVFNRFPRMIRDMAKDLGKDVVFSMSGEETELDRTVIDEIGDPLIHLLRNSIDHGIEPIEKRRRLGKPETGNIELLAYQDGNHVVIEVRDDGGGINIEKVRKKAIEKGLIDKDTSTDLTDKEVIGFLFMASFSMADKITDLSGRGVGLDAVKSKIETLGGTVEIESKLEKGSRFFIRLPLTLAIIQALLVTVGSEKYAIQLSSTHKIIKVLPEEIELVQKKEVILYRGMIVPVIRLKKVLGVAELSESTGPLTMVVVKKGDGLIALTVDKVLGQREIVQKSLGKFLSGVKLITSATILGDGNVALILDVNALAQ